jgi:hypothetical protein
VTIEVIGELTRKAILLDPVTRGRADALHILSGYAGAGAASRHLHELASLDQRCKVDLVIGMTLDGAVTKSAHAIFRRLTEVDFRDAFICKYLPIEKPSHAKIYIWTKADKPVVAWCSSANYSQGALYNFTQQEVVSPCDPAQAYEIFQNAFSTAMDCNAPNAEAMAFGTTRGKAKVPTSLGLEIAEDLEKLPKARLSLLTAHGRLVHNAGAGINWGQRGNRNPDEAYIPVSATLGRSGFFPSRGTFFSVRTETGLVMTCVRAQDNGKAIETPLDNSELGRWLRQQAGVPAGSLVQTEQLVSSGTDELEFIQLAPEEYLVRFPNKR